MSHFYKIKDTNDSWYKDFEEIYSKSFPVYEQRSCEQQLYAFSNERYNLFCLINEDENILNSFVSFWEFDEYVYVEHLAVNERLRGNNIGTATLKLFNDEVRKTVILEIDPVIDEVSAKRLQFYQKLGFELNLYKHYHPAYNSSYAPHELLVLNTGVKLTPALYNTFKGDLERVVMRNIES